MKKEESFDLILEKVLFRPFTPVFHYKGILVNGHFAVFTSVVPVDVRKKLYPAVINIPETAYEEAKARRYENVLSKLLEAKTTFENKNVVNFIPSGVLKNGDEEEEIVCMFFKKKATEELRVATYSRVYYEFITTVLGCVLYHDIEQNHAYIVCKDTREVAGLLMPVVPSYCTTGE